MRHAVSLMALPLLLLARIAAADPAPLPDVIQKVQASYEAVRDLSAEFRQETHYEGFDTVVNSTGRLQIKKPGKLRWDYAEPTPNQVVVADERVWIYTPEQKQVIVQPFAQMSDSQMPLHLLTGSARLDQDFEVRRTTPATDAKAIELTLVPRDAAAGLQKIEIRLDPKRYLITAVTLFESNGNRSAFEFNKIRTNTGLADEVFVFKKPKGVELIENPLGK